MKRWIALILCLITVFSIQGCSAEVSDEKSEISDFSLDAGESAFTTCWGYGIIIDDEKSNHNDIGLTFAVNGSAVNLKISLLTMEDYLNMRYDSARKSETVTYAGYKTVSFNNLDSGTYVLMWEQTGTSPIQITGAAFTYISDAEPVTEEDIYVSITMAEAGAFNIRVKISSSDSSPALIQEMSVSKLRLLTDEAESVLDGQYSEKMPIENSEGNMTISVEGASSAQCRLIITELTAYRKGEVPLSISGNWTNGTSSLT